MRKIKKGETVTAKRTFNKEIVTGKFKGYRLFNDENPDSVVGVVEIMDGTEFDVKVDSINSVENELVFRLNPLWDL